MDMGGADCQGSSGSQETLQNNVRITWQKWPGQGSLREGQCTCSHGNAMYMFGGVLHAASGDEDPVESSALIQYDADDGKWTTVGPKSNNGSPPSRAQASLAAVGNQLYLFGGVSHLTGWFNDFYVYDTTTNQWTEIKDDEGSRPCPRDKLRAVVDGTNIYYFGGFGPLLTEEEDIEDDDDEDWEDMDDDEVHGQELKQTPVKFGWFNDLYKFDTVTKTWSKPIQKNLGVPTPRAAHGMCLVGRELIIFGGRDSQSRTNDLFIFNIDTGMWRTDLKSKGRCPLPRSYHSVTTVSNTRMVVMGGLSQENRHFADMHVFDTETNEWLQPSVEGDKPAARGQHSAAVVGERFVVYGGTADSEPNVHDDTYVLNVGDLQAGGSLPSNGSGDPTN